MLTIQEQEELQLELQYIQGFYDVKTDLISCENFLEDLRRNDYVLL